MKSPALTRPVYRHAELDRVLNPNSVCIVGASPRTGSFGERVLANLSGFGGNIYLVNSKYQTIGERRCYASMAALPENPDCVAVVAPREAVEEIVLEAARLRVGANYLRRARISFSDYPAPRDMQGRSIGIASQSGALSQSLAQAVECGVSISHAFSAGNQADVEVRVSELAADQKDLVAELDINPIICTGGQMIAVDPLIVRAACRES